MSMSSEIHKSSFHYNNLDEKTEKVPLECNLNSKSNIYIKNQPSIINSTQEITFALYKSNTIWSIAD